jgi:predicted Rdx family selenoprotein
MRNNPELECRSEVQVQCATRRTWLVGEAWMAEALKPAMGELDMVVALLPGTGTDFPTELPESDEVWWLA